MHSKSAEETAKAFARIIKKMKQQKCCSNKGTEFKSAFERFCQSNNLATFSIHSEAKSDFTERYIRSLKSKIHSDSGNKWSCHFMNELQSFLHTIKSRVNRMTGLAPFKISKRHVSDKVLNKLSNRGYWFENHGLN